MRFTKWSYFSILFVLIFSIAAVKIYRWNGHSGNDWQTIIDGDGKGYYNYLPAIFIYQNISYAQEGTHGIIKTQNGTYNKYTIGESLLLAPFFGAACLTAKIGGYKIDGFSEPFQKWTSVAALFYLCLGLFALRKLLLNFGLDDRNIALVIIVWGMGSNLLYYSVIEPLMSHVFSFSIISCFLFSLSEFFKSFKNKFLFLSVFFLSLVILIRPINAVSILLIPFFIPTDKRTKEIILSKIKTIQSQIIIAGVFIFLISLQCFSWHLQTGKIFLWSYSKEGFYFLHPQFWNVLFSFKKGLLIYTPAVFISSFGLIVLFKKNRKEFFWVSIYLFVCIYLISAWWNWYFGDSFGHRAFIDFYSVFALLMAILLSSVKNQMVKISISLACFFCIFLNIFQSWQYHENIIHPYDMNWEKYKYVFLKTDDVYKDVIGGQDELPPYSKKPLTLFYSTINDYEKEYSGWSTGKKETDGQNSFCAYEGEFNTVFSIPLDSFVNVEEQVFISASLNRYEPKINNSQKTLFVIDIRDEKKQVYYYTFPVNELPVEKPNEWRTWNYRITIPDLALKNCTLKIYIWNREQKKFFIDNFKLDFYKTAE